MSLSIQNKVGKAGVERSDFSSRVAVEKGPRSGVAKETIVASADYSPRPDVALPETRYVQQGEEVKTVGKQSFKIPKVLDQWFNVKKQKIEEFKKVMQYQDPGCDVFSVSNEGFKCENWYRPCLRSENTPAVTCPPRKYDYGCDPHPASSKCVEYGDRVLSTQYAGKFSDLQNIKRDGHVFASDDNLSFNGPSGERTIDFNAGGVSSDEENATKAAQLLVDIQDVGDSIRKDHQESPLIKSRQDALALYQAAKESDPQEVTRKKLEKLVELTMTILSLPAKEREIIGTDLYPRLSPEEQAVFGKLMQDRLREKLLTTNMSPEQRALFMTLLPKPATGESLPSTVKGAP